jgi:hypothetical protein
MWLQLRHDGYETKNDFESVMQCHGAHLCISQSLDCWEVGIEVLHHLRYQFATLSSLDFIQSVLMCFFFKYYYNVSLEALRGMPDAAAVSQFLGVEQK